MLLKSLFSQFLNLICVGTPISCSGVWIYHNYYPKTIGDWLKKQEKTSIDSGKNEHFRAMFEENKSFASDLGIDLLGQISPLEDVEIVKISQKCNELLLKSWDQKLFEVVEKFCVYKPKTNKGIIFSDKKIKSVISQEEDYKVNFAVYKHHQKSLNHISEANNSMGIEEGYKKVKAWCEAELNKKVDSSKNEDFYEALMVWCTPSGFKTVEEKIKKDDVSWTLITEDSKWQDQFETWKTKQEVITSMNGDDSSSNLSSLTDKKIGGSKMKTWCEGGLEKNLYDVNVYQQLYSLIKSVCKKTN